MVLRCHCLIIPTFACICVYKYICTFRWLLVSALLGSNESELKENELHARTRSNIQNFRQDFPCYDLYVYILYHTYIIIPLIRILHEYPYQIFRWRRRRRKWGCCCVILQQALLMCSYLSRFSFRVYETSTTCHSVSQDMWKTHIQYICSKTIFTSFSSKIIPFPLTCSQLSSYIHYHTKPHSIWPKDE